MFRIASAIVASAAANDLRRVFRDRQLGTEGVGLHTTNMRLLKDKECNRGFKVVGSKCVQCEDGLIQPYDHSKATYCEECPTGEFSNNYVTCIPCVAVGGTLEENEAGVPIKCKCNDGQKFEVDGDATMCTDCGEDEIGDGETCTPCPGGKEPNDDKNLCVDKEDKKPYYPPHPLPVVVSCCKDVHKYDPRHDHEDYLRCKPCWDHKYSGCRSRSRSLFLNLGSLSSLRFPPPAPYHPASHHDHDGECPHDVNPDGSCESLKCTYAPQHGFEGCLHYGECEPAQNGGQNGLINNDNGNDIDQNQKNDIDNTNIGIGIGGVATSDSTLDISGNVGSGTQGIDLEALVTAFGTILP